MFYTIRGIFFAVNNTELIYFIYNNIKKQFNLKKLYFISIYKFLDKDI